MEVVDKRNPTLLRVATVAEVTGFQIKIHFDGWRDIYDYWSFIDSDNLHPVGWANQTCDTLYTPHDIAEFNMRRCSVPECNGIGNAKGPQFQYHDNEEECPYSQQNIFIELPDRFQQKKNIKPNLPTRHIPTKFEPVKIDCQNKNVQINRSSIENEEKNDGNFVKSSTKIGEWKSASGSYKLKASSDHTWDQFIKFYPNLLEIKYDDVLKWTVDDVSGFIECLTENKKIAESFKNEEIDGEALLLLTTYDIAKVMDIKLGPAVKIHNAIKMIKCGIA